MTNTSDVYLSLMYTILLNIVLFNAIHWIAYNSLFSIFSSWAQFSYITS
jgi:hypothetical protein